MGKIIRIIPEFRIHELPMRIHELNSSALIEFDELVKLSNDSLLQMHELWRDNMRGGW